MRLAGSRDAESALWAPCMHRAWRAKLYGLRKTANCQTCSARAVFGRHPWQRPGVGWRCRFDLRFPFFPGFSSPPTSYKGHRTTSIARFWSRTARARGYSEGRKDCAVEGRDEQDPGLFAAGSESRTVSEAFSSCAPSFLTAVLERCIIISTGPVGASSHEKFRLAVCYPGSLAL